MKEHKHDDKCGHMPMKKEKKHEKAPKGDKAKKKISKVLHEYKDKELHSGSKKGPKVKSRKQALAIAISESKKK